MKGKYLVLKANVNKNNKQMNVVLPKKKLKAMNPKIKFGDSLFVKIEVFHKKKK